MAETTTDSLKKRLSDLEDERVQCLKAIQAEKYETARERRRREIAENMVAELQDTMRICFNEEQPSSPRLPTDLGQNAGISAVQGTSHYEHPVPVIDQPAGAHNIARNEHPVIMGPSSGSRQTNNTASSPHQKSPPPERPQNKTKQGYFNNAATEQHSALNSVTPTNNRGELRSTLSGTSLLSSDSSSPPSSYRVAVKPKARPKSIPGLRLGGVGPGIWMGGESTAGEVYHV